MRTALYVVTGVVCAWLVGHVTGLMSDWPLIVLFTGVLGGYLTCVAREDDT